jgi:Undecaprenyl-phosphate galactose phosphotransferase WbaP
MTVAAHDVEANGVRALHQRHLSSLRLARSASLILADLLGLLSGFLAGGVVVVLFSQHFTGKSYTDLFLFVDLSSRATAFALFGGLLVGWLMHCGHYGMRLPFWTEIRQVLVGCSLALLADGFLQFAMKNDFSRLWLVNSWIVAALAIIVMRQVARTLLSLAGLWRIRALVVGGAAHRAVTTAGLRADWGLGYEVVGEMSMEDVKACWGGSWSALCRCHRAETVVLALGEHEMETNADRLAHLALEQIPFTCVQSLRGLPVVSVDAHHIVGHDILMLSGFFPMFRPLSRFTKLAFDYIMALLLLLFSLPLLLLIAASVALDGGTVLYEHTRVGRDGRLFQCLKFRTMMPNATQVLAEILAQDPVARQEWEETRKLKDDRRITRLGHFLRRYSLDELPQLVNVLRGEMSLIGPRPMTKTEIDNYGEGVDFYLQVRPGITGLWQVSGRNNLGVVERNELNTWYVKNWSFWLDVTILLRTVPTVLGREGAY